MKVKSTETSLAAIYYSPQGYWRGLAAIQKLAAAAMVSEDVARQWLKRQAIWQIYLPAPRHIPRAFYDITEPNEVHQADLLFLPHDRVGRRTYKYALTVVDIASRFKEAEPLATKSSSEVAEALSRIYKRGPLRWPKLLMVDPGSEFKGEVAQLLAKHEVHVRRGRMYASERSVEWVARLPAVVAALNGEVTRLTGRKPIDAIEAITVTARPSAPVAPGRPMGLEEPVLPSGVQVRYLYASSPGEHELEGGRRRATDPVWSLTTHSISDVMRQEGQPALYHLVDGPARGFVREELLVVPPDTELPPDRVLTPIQPRAR